MTDENAMKTKYMLRRGTKGQEVRRLQSKLGIVSDGDYGPITERTVTLYQQNQGLYVDGIAGPQTLGSLEIRVEPGIDVSAWNGEIDWEKVAAYGIKYAWVKHTEGQTHKNKWRSENIEGARNNGLVAGAYHFGRPDTNRTCDLGDARKEARFFLKHYKPLEGDLIPALDVEKGVKVDDTYNAEWCLEWCRVVEKELGVAPIIYTAKFAIDLFLKHAKKELLQDLSAYHLWLARYRSDDKLGYEPKGFASFDIWDTWTVWQTSGSGRVDGIKGKVDTNWMAGGMLDVLRI